MTAPKTKEATALRSTIANVRLENDTRALLFLTVARRTEITETLVDRVALGLGVSAEVDYDKAMVHIITDRDVRELSRQHVKAQYFHTAFPPEVLVKKGLLKKNSATLAWQMVDPDDITTYEPTELGLKVGKEAEKLLAQRAGGQDDKLSEIDEELDNEASNIAESIMSRWSDDAFVLIGIEKYYGASPKELETRLRIPNLFVAGHEVCERLVNDYGVVGFWKDAQNKVRFRITDFGRLVLQKMHQENKDRVTGMEAGIAKLMVGQELRGNAASASS